MTQWIENPEGGRDRGPRAVLRAWAEVLVAPRRFFRAGVAPADQAPGLFFLIAVVLAAEGSRILLTGGPAPVVGGRSGGRLLLGLALGAFLVAPLALHLLVALQTVLLRPFVPERAGVSETVQLMAYATAPCALAGVPFAPLRVVCTVWGAALLVVGIAVVHETSYPRAAAAALVPAALGFGYAFRGFGAARTLIEWGDDYLGDVVGLLAYI